MPCYTIDCLGFASASPLSSWPPLPPQQSPSSASASFPGCCTPPRRISVPHAMHNFYPMLASVLLPSYVKLLSLVCSSVQDFYPAEFRPMHGFYLVHVCGIQVACHLSPPPHLTCHHIGQHTTLQLITWQFTFDHCYDSSVVRLGNRCAPCRYKT